MNRIERKHWVVRRRKSMNNDIRMYEKKTRRDITPFTWKQKYATAVYTGAPAHNFARVSKNLIFNFVIFNSVAFENYTGSGNYVVYESSGGTRACSCRSFIWSACVGRC